MKPYLKYVYIKNKMSVMFYIQNNFNGLNNIFLLFLQKLKIKNGCNAHKIK